jgi:hypothetical protein
MREGIHLLDRPRDQLRFMIEASAEEYDWTLWIELWARALRDPASRQARQRLDNRWREEIAAVIRAGQGAGEFGDADADEVALLLGSLLDGLAVQATLHDPDVIASGCFAVRSRWPNRSSTVSWGRRPRDRGGGWIGSTKIRCP